MGRPFRGRKRRKDAEDALAAGDLEQARAAAGSAVSLARRPFLPGEDGTWVEEKRSELADLRECALGVLSDACLRSGAAREAAKWAEGLVALSPLRETGYRRPPSAANGPASASGSVSGVDSMIGFSDAVAGGQV